MRLLTWLLVASMFLAGAACLRAQEPTDAADFVDLALTPGGAAAGTAGDEALRKAFEALPGPLGGSRVRLLADNVEAWCARWWLMGQARQTIDSTYFILEKDIFGASFLGYLFKQARDGRKIRLMIDCSGDPVGKKSFKTTLMGQDYLQELVSAGITVRLYEPVLRKAGQQIREGLSKSTAAIASNHDKILVADGEWSMTGGRNISKDYFLDPKDMPGVFRDTDVLIQGADVAKGLSAAFDVEYENKKATLTIKRDRLDLSDKSVHLLGAWLMMDAWLRSSPCDEAEAKGLRSDQSARAAAAAALVADATRRLTEVGVKGKPSRAARRKLDEWALELAGYPAYRGAYAAFNPETGARSGEIKILDQTSTRGKEPVALSDELLTLVAATQRRIVIQNPYVVLTDRARAALEAASARGVQIRLLTNSPASSDSDLTQAFFIEDWPAVAARIPTLQIHVLTGARKLHAKVAVFDDVLSIVGTYNLDLISARINSEVASATWSREFAGDVLASFEADLKAPDNAVKEYTIKRDAEGRAVLTDGAPVVTYGAKDHIDGATWDKFLKLREKAKLLKKLKQASSLR